MEAVLKSAMFGDSFEDANLTFAYNPSIPVISSSDLSHWARGHSSELFDSDSNASSLTVDSLPSGLEFNSSSKTISGVPENAGTFQITITASTPSDNHVQTHIMKIMDPLAFSTKLTLNSNLSSLGQVPSD